MRRSYIVIASLAALSLSGCSGVKTYSSVPDKNFRIETKIDSGSALKSTVAEFDIHRVDAACNTHYLGRVYLDKASTTVGIPPNEMLYLDFIFASKGFLSSNISATRYTTLLATRRGFEYDAQVKYIKGIYSVGISERRNGSRSARVLEKQPLDRCRVRK